MTDNPFSVGIAIAIVVASIAGFIGYEIINDIALSDDMKQYVNDSAEWCDERNGTLVNSRAFGPGGGLHCDLPNGTLVEMDQVVKYG